MRMPWKLWRFLSVLALVCFGTGAWAAVDLNKATQAELESVKGIGPAVSGRILDERKKSPFKDWDDFIGRVKGVGPGNAARFSEAGLTVGGSGFGGAVASAKKSAQAEPAAATLPAKK